MLTATNVADWLVALMYNSSPVLATNANSNDPELAWTWDKGCPGMLYVTCSGGTPLAE